MGLEIITIIYFQYFNMLQWTWTGEALFAPQVGLKSKTGNIDFVVCDESPDRKTL